MRPKSNQYMEVEWSVVDCLTAINNWLDAEKREERREQVSSKISR